jgi:hypothetical protein
MTRDTDTYPQSLAGDAPRAETPIRQAIAYGIQAPNPHNTQAWKFELTSDTEALLYIDERRLLPVTDPPARQIHIGAGCCIETLAVGMSGHGYRTDVEYLPGGAHGLDAIGRKPVARITLHKAATARRDELADSIRRRQTNRKPYTGPFLTDQEADLLRSQAASPDVELVTLNQPDEMRPLLDIFYRAMQIEVTTPRTWEESRIWFRYNERQRRAQLDGLSTAQAGIDGIPRRLTEWYLRDGDPTRWFSKRSTSSFLKSFREGVDSAKGVLLLKTQTNRQQDWLEVGRAFARVHLGLTQLGMTCHHCNQVLQEYPEMTEQQAEFNQLLGVQPPEKVQIAVRVGRAEQAYVALRRNPQQFLLGDSRPAPSATPTT